jgi:hypothetical protein
VYAPASNHQRRGLVEEHAVGHEDGGLAQKLRDGSPGERSETRRTHCITHSHMTMPMPAESSGPTWASYSRFDNLDSSSDEDEQSTVSAVASSTRLVSHRPSLSVRA